MNCAEVRDRLDAFHRGEGDAPERAAIAAHLAECGECRLDVEAAWALGPLVAALPRAIAPETDLWDGIASRIGPRRPGRVTVPVWVLIAASVVLVGATSVVTRTVWRTPTAAPALPPGFTNAEARYLATAFELSQVYLKARDALAPETRAVIDRNLAVIERALIEAREALERDPANTTLEALVLASYRRKIEFLERASTLDRES
jgi:anti-sigma factor RsiW